MTGFVVSEVTFTAQVRDLAGTFHYMRYHTWLSKHSSPGFPDEVLVRPPRLIFAELKSEAGKPTGAQEAWLDALALTGAEVYLWRPAMFDAIAECLRHVERPAPVAGVGVWPA